MEKTYKIVVTSYGENPNYEAEKAEFIADQEKRVAREYYNGNRMETRPEDHLSRMKEERFIEVVLTEKEYLAVKQSVISTFA